MHTKDDKFWGKLLLWTVVFVFLSVFLSLFLIQAPKTQAKRHKAAPIKKTRAVLLSTSGDTLKVWNDVEVGTSGPKVFIYDGTTYTTVVGGIICAEEYYE